MALRELLQDEELAAFAARKEGADREAALRQEGHSLRVLHQPDVDEYQRFESEIETQLGFEITGSPASGLMGPDGGCAWLDYGACTGGSAPAAELSTVVWELTS